MPSKSTKITPIGDRILIKMEEKSSERKTASGIIIPETVSEGNSSKKGEVIAVGEGRMENGKLVKPQVKVGDFVIFSWGEDINIDGEDYYLVNEQNVLAVINN